MARLRRKLAYEEDGAALGVAQAFAAGRQFGVAGVLLVGAKAIRHGIVRERIISLVDRYRYPGGPAAAAQRKGKAPEMRGA